MRKVLFSGCVIAGAICFITAAPAASSEAERGRYLVEDVAKCADCHTPRLQNGEPDKSHPLTGAMLAFAPTAPIPNWKAMSPNITPGGRLWKHRGEAAIQKFLENGVWPDGDRADPPMPDYHFSAEDAKAVIAYLKTLQ